MSLFIIVNRRNLFGISQKNGDAIELHLHRSSSHWRSLSQVEHAPDY